MFQFYDMHSYALDMERHSFLVRPVLSPHRNWAVKYWNVLKYRRFSYTKENVEICRRDILSNLEISFLSRTYLNDNTGNPLYGFCYLCTQTVFYLMQTQQLSPWSGVDDLGTSHWWLRDNFTDELIDPTASQYDFLNCDPPYATGKKRKWYGFRPFPQMRTLDLIQKIQPDAKRSKTLHLENLSGKI